MHALNSLHKTVIVRPGNAKLFKRLLSEDMMADCRVISTEFDKLWRQYGVLLKLREGEHPAVALLGGRGGRLLESAFKVDFTQGGLTVKKPVAVNTPGDVARTTGKANRVRRGFVVSRDFAGMVKDKNALLRETRLHSVENFLHAGAVVLVFLVKLAQHVKDDKIGALGPYKALNEVLTALRSYQKREHHVVLVDKAKIGDIEVVSDFLKFPESFSPGGFFSIHLNIKDFLRGWALVAHDRLALGYLGGNVECQKAFTHLRRAEQEHVTRFGDQTSD